ncbi:tetratricopeptide repeat protein, partial [Sulfurimonas sp.]|uniref:tetratricopeptide repeat protein n=1 Tax=Sulfurimonas sp. TaxID=2022749 RepID=UPI003D1526BD
LLITLLLTSALVAEVFHKPDYDPRLSIDQRALEWWNHAGTDSASAFNIGLLYDIRIKDYKKAELWYKQAINVDPKNIDALINLGGLYDDLNNHKKAEYWYQKALKLEPDNPTGLFNLALLYKAKLNNPKLAIKYYKKAFKTGKIDAANNLGYLYDTVLNDTQNAKEWYVKAIKGKSLDAIKNLGRLYHYKLHDDVKAAEYFIALIDNKYPKKKVITYLKTKWELSDKTIKQGYEAQLKSKIIPEKLKYRGGI